MTCESCTSLTARLQQAEQERDEARADAGELAAITAVVSDQEEVGTYAKVEALVIATEAAERHGIWWVSADAERGGVNSNG